ncbi:MAG TPA: nuclease, partial [Candidatus Omnitrophota bacterium]|nr:nuclease [Candidatus Omnitrophota bacterium]
GVDVTTRVRLRGIDTPELRGPCPQAALDAKDALARLIGTGPVTLIHVAPDKYGSRVDATLLLPSGMDASAALRAGGHAAGCR